MLLLPLWNAQNMNLCTHTNDHHQPICLTTSIWLITECFMDLFAVECCLFIIPDFQMHQGLDVWTRKKKNYDHRTQWKHNDWIWLAINTGLMEEVASYEELDGIDIMTDARHGWRKNAKGSSIVAIGEKSHKVLNCVHITKVDDVVSQRHEKLGTKRLHTYFESKDVSINVHTNDRNMTIIKLMRNQGYIVNQNDSLHGVKIVKR